MKHPQELRDLAAFWRKEADSLQEKHSGVRPGWVSTEISLALHRAQTLEAEANALEAAR